MERTEDFCFESKYLRSNMNQLRKEILKKKNWSTITQSNNTKVNFKCFKQKQELNVKMSCPIILLKINQNEKTAVA
jgi:hypothetical protein